MLTWNLEPAGVNVLCTRGSDLYSWIQFLTVLGCWLLGRDEGAFQAQAISSGDADASDNTACISAYLKAWSIGALPFSFLLSLWGKSFASINILQTFCSKYDPWSAVCPIKWKKENEAVFLPLWRRSGWSVR